MSKEKNNEIKLTVAEARRQKDVGKNVARVSKAVMNKLKVKQGDIIEIEGNKKSGAIVRSSYREDEGLDIIRLDGLERKNAGTSIGEKVTVRKAEVKEAETVTIAPTEQNIQIRGGGQALKKSLLGRPMSKGDLVTPTGMQGDIFSQIFGGMFQEMGPSSSFGLGEIRFMVTNSSPDGIVLITKRTNINLSSQPAEVQEAAAPAVTYEDIGGLDKEIQRVREMVELPLRHPELFDRLGIDPPKGVLLHGPPGTGKTLTAKAVANESDAHFQSLAGPEIMSKFYGESEKKLRQIFEEAEKNAPSVIFIDEIDAIASKREEATGDVEKRVVSQLLTLMDGLESRGKIIVIAATNRVDAVDPALRRPGRFDREIEIGIPDRDARKEILQIHTRGMPMEDNVDLDNLSNNTHGYVGADLASLAREAAMNALRDILPEIELDKKEIPSELLEKLKVSKENFRKARQQVEPSAMREVLVQVPDTNWKDIGGLEDSKQQLKESVEWPLKNPEAFQQVGIEPPRGVLLYGPPGTGKTMLARAVATESDANFISIKGPELLSKWVGESEKAVRETFKKARQAAPTVIFFDEIDALVPKRGMRSAGSQVGERVISQLLTEIDGLEELEDVIVIGATNRPDLVDPALMRPGRFDRVMMVPAPDRDAREEIFRIHTKEMPIADDVNLSELADRSEGYSGADIAAVCKEAGILALREDIKSNEVKKKHFDNAMKSVGPSITDEITDTYEEFKNKYGKEIGEKAKEQMKAYY
ncbi:MAG: CDC48 family AAA ATPase [Candidatus Hadarchaeia archaeon]